MMHESSAATRPAAVAGTFYPGERATLQGQLAQLLESCTGQPSAVPKVLIVPHAGYIYSGATAARAYARLRPVRDRVRRVLLLGPAHRVYLRGMAVPSVDRFATPLGDVTLDRAGRDTAAALPGVIIDDNAHALEHSLEVQLPFLQTVLGDFALLPVVVGDASAGDVAGLIDTLWGGPETLVVVSTDLSHFHDYDAAQRLDRATCERILGRATDLDGDEACGARVLNGLLGSRHMRELSIELLELCNSGDTAGSRDRVVGYGAFAAH